MVAEVVESWEGDAKSAGWPSWTFENHDAPRAVSRWCTPEHADRFARVKMTQHSLALRRSSAALRIGRIENVVVAGSLLSFDRVAAGQHLRCLFNLSPNPLKQPSVPAHAAIVASVNGATPQSLPGYSAIYLTL